jgi:hypothetical protein
MTDPPRTPILPEDHSEIVIVPDAQRDVWLTDEQRRQPGIPDFSMTDPPRTPTTQAGRWALGNAAISLRAILAIEAEARAGLVMALRALRDMSDDLADAVLDGVKPDDIGQPDWDAANDALRAALTPKEPDHDH